MLVTMCSQLNSYGFLGYDAVERIAAMAEDKLMTPAQRRKDELKFEKDTQAWCAERCLTLGKSRI